MLRPPTSLQPSRCRHGLLALALTACTAADALDNFITRQEDRLMDGTKEFRFVGVNSSHVFLSWTHPEAPVTEAFEQTDLLKALRQMGCSVLRAYCITVGPQPLAGGIPGHVAAPNTFTEAFFRSTDRLLQLANEHGIRVIVVLNCNWDCAGGKGAYAKFRGRPEREFFTDADLRRDFKDTISYVLNRVNVFTGTAYKDDKAVLCWELGNELWGAPREWVAEMAAHIKSIDANHLVMDDIRSDWAVDPNVDILTQHYYLNHFKDFTAACRQHRRYCASPQVKRPFVIGEFGSQDASGGPGVAAFGSMLDEALANGTSGALLWELVPHSRFGGYCNRPRTVAEGPCYRWPGHDTPGTYPEEKDVLAILPRYAFAMRGLPVPAHHGPPEPPAMLPVNDVRSIDWLGSAGAVSYIVERAPQPGGPWASIASGVTIADRPHVPFSDNNAREGASYYYRVKAVNQGGVSAPSAAAGPARHLVMLVDGLDDWSKTHSHTPNLGFSTNHQNCFEGDTSRVYRTAAVPSPEEIVYHRMGIIRFEATVWFWPEEPVSHCSLFTSADGSSWAEVDASIAGGAGDWRRFTYVLNDLTGCNYVKIRYNNLAGKPWSPGIGQVRITSFPEPTANNR